jgi:uncharacterized protein
VADSPLAPVIARFSIDSADDVQLEARWDMPVEPQSLVVFCHPHPQHRGTMTAPLMIGVTTELVQAGFGVLRFNFRGVGSSTGEWSAGEGEQSDVGAAVAFARDAYPDLPLGIAGWSFGAATSLRWQERDRSALPWVGIAPPVFSDLTPRLPEPDTLLPARRAFVVGDRDQFVGVEQLSTYAGSIDADLHVLKGSDHFFYFRYSKVAGHVIAALRPRVAE